MLIMAVYLCTNCLPVAGDVQTTQEVDTTQMVTEYQVEQDFAACSNEKKCKGKKPKNQE
jgi:hypothetical protein